MSYQKNIKPTKFSKSRSLGEIRATKRIKKFLNELLDKETRHDSGNNLWHDALFDNSRDTKQYYRYLVLRLSQIAYDFAIYNSEKYLKDNIARHLKRLEEDLIENGYSN